jgi:hypothetical protein
MQLTCCRVYFIVVAFSLTISARSAPTASSQTATQSPGKTIACRVIESKNAQTLGVRVVVFHQAEIADRGSLGRFLRNHDGASAEFEAANGSWQAASVFRLKSCFGRGLLLLPAGGPRLAEGDRFMLRSGANPEN